MINGTASKTNNFKREDEFTRFFALPATDLVKGKLSRCY